ncbi:hypothetical protein TYRP_023219 [Tyrophagus putrescentiae]|nr:hypothetical protein TYRP_023219 [Tyrophagus putrescentiae]
MRKSLGLGRNRKSSKPPDLLTVENTSKSFSGNTAQQRSTNSDDTTATTMDIPDDGDFGTLKVQQSFVQSPSESTPTVAAAVQPTGAFSDDASNQGITSLDSLTQLIADEKAMANDCLPGTSASVQSGPVKNPVKRPSDAKPVVSKRQKPSSKVPANIRSITDYFPKRDLLPSTSKTPDTAAQLIGEEDHCDDIIIKTASEPSTSKMQPVCSKRKLPVKGSKEYKRCLDNWNIYKEVTELVDSRPDLLQTQRYEIVAARHNVLFTKIRQKYIRIILRIEMSGKPITPDHPINNELLQMLAISESEAVKFSKAKTSAKLDKVIEKDEKEIDSSEDEVDESPTRTNASSRFEKGSPDYNRIRSNWTVYKKIEMLQRSNPELDTLKKRCQFLATQQKVEVSFIRNKYKYVQRRLNMTDKYISIKHSFNKEICDILSIRQRKKQTQPKPPFFWSIKDKNEKISLIKQELEQALKYEVPDDEQFLYIAKKLNTSERIVHIEFVHIKVQECREKQITSSTMLSEIRNEAINTLDKLKTTELCTLKAEEKMILSFFEPSIKPFALQCTLQHIIDNQIGFCLHSRSDLLNFAKLHLRKSHHDLYQSLDKSASYQDVNEKVHQIFSIVAEALNYVTMTSSLIVLSHICQVTPAFAKAEQIIIKDLTFDPLPPNLGVEVQNQWVFSFFRLSENGDQFKCRLWHHSEKEKVVQPNVYFEDGTSLDRHLFQHLLKYHKIPTDYGASNDSYFDSHFNQTICLKSMV